jgi:hypothetical protein
MAYPGDKTNYPTGLNLINRPTQKEWPVIAPFKNPIIQNLPSIIANGVDRTYLPQLANGPIIGSCAIRAIRKGLSKGIREGFMSLTVKNIPKTMEGTQEWYPGALVQSLPSVVADIAGASGPRRTMSGQYTDHRNYSLNPECSVEI